MSSSVHFHAGCLPFFVSYLLFSASSDIVHLTMSGNLYFLQFLYDVLLLFFTSFLCSALFLFHWIKLCIVLLRLYLWYRASLCCFDSFTCSFHHGLGKYFLRINCGIGSVLASVMRWYKSIRKSSQLLTEQFFRVFYAGLVLYTYHLASLTFQFVVSASFVGSSYVVRMYQ